MEIADIARYAAALAVVALFVYVAVEDFQKLRIANRTVLAGLAVYVLWAALGGFAGALGELSAGLLLFAIGLGLWLAGLVGAGDAKLMLVCGLFTGLEHLGYFAIGLIVATLAFYAAIKVARLPQVEMLLVFARLRAIGGLGKVPYGVPLSAAAIYAFLMRGI